MILENFKKRDKLRKMIDKMKNFLIRLIGIKVLNM